MSIDEIERAIEKLPPADQAKLRAKIARDEWDREIEADAKSGKLDEMFKESEEDFKAGRYRPL